MRADKPIRFYDLYGNGNAELADYINKLRYERLMAKAKYFRSECLDNHFVPYGERCERIAEAYEARANKIKEYM